MVLEVAKFKMQEPAPNKGLVVSSITALHKVSEERVRAGGRRRKHCFLRNLLP